MQASRTSGSIQFRAAVVVIVLITLSAIALREDILQAAEYQLATHMIFEHALFFSIGALSVLAGEAALRFLAPSGGGRAGSLRSQAAKIWKSLLRGVFGRVPGLVWLGAAVGLMAFWHLPEVFDLAVMNESAHMLQHFSFVAVGTAGFIATRIFGDSFRILLLFMIIGMMGFAGLIFTVLDSPVYGAYSVPDHRTAGDYMIIASMLVLMIGLPAFLISRTFSYIRSVKSDS